MVVRPQSRVPKPKTTTPVVMNTMANAMAQQSSQAQQPMNNVPSILKPTIKPTTEVRNFGLGSAEGGPVSSNMATRQQPVRVVREPKPTAPDYNTMDVGGLQDELIRYKYRQQTGNFSEDDAVNYNRIARLLGEKTLASNTQQIDTSAISELERQREEERIRREGSTASELDAFRRQQEALRDQRIADLEKSGAAQREAAQTATSFSGFGRSTFNAQQQSDIEEQKQRSILAAKAAADLEIQRREAELKGADTEVLASYDQRIAEARGQATQLQQEMEANARKIQQEQSTIFGNTLKELVANSGMQLDPNDEKALEQVINIARNTDGSVNEEVVAGLPQQFQALVRAGVMNGIGRASFTPKVERIGGTTKSPVFGYRDPNQQRFVTTNAMGVPTGGTVRAGGGGVGGGGVGGGITINDQKQDLLSRFENIKNTINNSLLPGGTALLVGQAKADYDFIRNNLMLKKFSDAKAAGVTFGAASNAEWEALKKAATSLTTDPFTSKGYLNKEIDRLITQSGGQPQQKETTTQGKIQTNTETKSNDPLGLR